MLLSQYHFKVIISIESNIHESVKKKKKKKKDYWKDSCVLFTCLTWKYVLTVSMKLLTYSFKTQHPWFAVPPWLQNWFNPLNPEIHDVLYCYDYELDLFFQNVTYMTYLVSWLQNLLIPSNCDIHDWLYSTAMTAKWSILSNHDFPGFLYCGDGNSGLIVPLNSKIHFAVPLWKQIDLSLL